MQASAANVPGLENLHRAGPARALRVALARAGQAGVRGPATPARQAVEALPRQAIQVLPRLHGRPCRHCHPAASTRTGLPGRQSAGGRANRVTLRQGRIGLTAGARAGEGVRRDPLTSRPAPAALRPAAVRPAGGGIRVRALCGGDSDPSGCIEPAYRAAPSSESGQDSFVRVGAGHLYPSRDGRPRASRPAPPPRS